MSEGRKFTHHDMGIGKGAGAGGGLGLNAAGFGPKVKHFAAKGGIGSGPALSDDMKAAWESMVSPTDPDVFGWLISQYDASGKSVKLGQTGGGGLQDFKAALQQMDSVAWGGFVCNAVDNRGNLVSKRKKFIFVQYMPSSAPAMRKAKMGSHKGALKECFNRAHLDILVENIEEDLDPVSLAGKLQSATGAHKPNGYEFDKGVITDANYYNDV